MILDEKTTYIMDKLEALYPNPSPPLDHSNNYTLLIAVLLSAQCTDKRVNLITPKLFDLADNPLDMSKIPVDEIRKIVRPCGLSEKKSNAISELSKILVESYNSQVPDDINELEKLPGVGHKTASVVMTQAFDQPAFPVDTHIHRLAKRWKLSEGKSIPKIEKDLKAIFPKDKWGKLHLQIIFYGREYCSARGCDGTKCIICKKVNSISD